MKNPKNWIRLFFVAYLLVVFFFADYFHYMLLNVFLAYIPIEIGFWLQPKRPEQDFLFWLGAFLWLLFFPNVPYLLTDYFHLRILNPETSVVGVMVTTPLLWKNFLILTTGIVPFVILGFQSWHHVLSVVTRRFFKKHPQVFGVLLLTVAVLSSIAIYWGRILRVHSIHVFTKPLATLKVILAGIQPEMVSFVVGFTLLHLILYVCVNRAALFGKRKVRT